MLLIDDPPNPRYEGPRRLLDAAQALPAEIERLLSEPRQRAEQALARFQDTIDRDRAATLDAVVALASEGISEDIKRRRCAYSHRSSRK